MTPNHDHATLFLAPSAPPRDEARSRPRRTVRDDAETMRRLRHPFTIPPLRATKTELSHVA